MFVQWMLMANQQMKCGQEDALDNITVTVLRNLDTADHAVTPAICHSPSLGHNNTFGSF